MSKTLGNKDNFTIVVEPRSMSDFGSISVSRELLYGHDKVGQARWEREMQDRCGEMIADMKRHIDNFGSARIEFDQEHICEHCGSIWTEAGSEYNGGCCSSDEEAEEERAKAAGEQQ